MPWSRSSQCRTVASPAPRLFLRTAAHPHLLTTTGAVPLANRRQLYSRLNARLGAASSGRGDVESGASSAAEDATADVSVALEIERLLTKLAEVNARMERCSAAGSTASRALLKRFREILSDYKAEFRRTQASIVRKRESAELFREVDAERRVGGQGQQHGATDQLLRERGALGGSHRGAESVIGQALSVRESLRGQRMSLSGAGGKLVQMGRAVPGVNNLIQLIQRKRTRARPLQGRSRAPPHPSLSSARVTGTFAGRLC